MACAAPRERFRIEGTARQIAQAGQFGRGGGAIQNQASVLQNFAARLGGVALPQIFAVPNSTSPGARRFEAQKRLLRRRNRFGRRRVGPRQAAAGQRLDERRMDKRIEPAAVVGQGAAAGHGQTIRQLPVVQDGSAATRPADHRRLPARRCASRSAYA